MFRATLEPNSVDPLKPETRCDAVVRALSYRFRDESLLVRALRHASVGGVDRSDNERLEFLGDAMIGLAVAAWLFDRHPAASEGALTERRARIVSRAHLARVARRIGLEPLVETKLHGGPLGRLPDSVIGGALEALIGAIYLESGADVARRIVCQLFQDDDDPAPQPNVKAELQHFVQVRHNIVPSYKLISEKQHAFGRSFCISAEVNGRLLASAWGCSKREAEHNAALEALMQLRDEEPAERPLQSE